MGSVSLKFWLKPSGLSFTLALCLAFVPLFLQWPLFWDNLPYVGGIADFFYEHGVVGSLFHLPKDWDVAHSPIFAAILAEAWHLLGKSLLSSFLVQLPLVTITLYCSYELISLFSSNFWLKLAFTLLLLADTHFFTQLNQIGYEWIMLAPFMWSLLQLFRHFVGKDEHWTIYSRYSIWVWVLPFTQLRGLNMVLLLVGVSFVLNQKKIGLRKAFSVILKRDSLLVLGAGLITFSWLLLHKWKCGYWTNASGVAWSGEHLIPSNVFDFCYKIAISVWRMFDYGFVSYLVVIPVVWKLLRKRKSIDSQFALGGILFVASFGILAIQFSFFDIPICHRYFLILHLLLPVLFVWLLAQVEQLKSSVLIFIICILGVSSGYEWEYPERMANGREVQASSMCYFPLRDSVEKYMQVKNISNNEVVSHFPICVPNDWVKLTNTNQGALCGDIDTAKSPRYIIYSNFSNGFTDAEKLQISKMDTVRFWKNGPIHLMLLRCP